MVERIKTNVDRLLLVSNLKENYISENLFSSLKLNVVYLRPFLFSLPFPKFRKQHFIYFGHKHFETGANCLHELATFLKYHMPLIHVLNKGQ